MKLIEALKKLNDLAKKAEDYRALVKKNCVISSLTKPVYPDQEKKVKEWIQGHSDLLKETLRLRMAIQKTNLETPVTIEIDGKAVTKSIAEWIHRRRDLAVTESKMWEGLTDRGIQEGLTAGPGGDQVKIEIVRYFNPETRDKMRYSYSTEPSLIDGKLEVANAITDLIE